MQGNSFIGTLILTTFVVSFSWTAAQPKSDWTVGILVYDGVYNTEFVAPMDVFDHVTAQRTATVRVILVAPRAKSVRSVEKLNFQADYSFEDHPPIDILVVPSFQNYQDDLERRDEIIAWVRKTASSARFVLSNCWGAFYLAKAGLLDGRMAMTYPPDIDKLGQQFPKVKAVKGHRFVRDGKFVTGGGGVASYDNSLYVVEQLWGAETARTIARGLVKNWDLVQVPHLIAPW